MRATVCVLVLFSAQAAVAQWTLTNLNPGIPFSSEGHGVHSGRQVGSIIVGKPQAVVWSGSAGSWVGLNPPGANYSEGRGAYGDKQIGVALFDGYFHGGIWTGTASSWVDLTPIGASQSSVNDIYENVQVGDAFEPPHASLWFGSPVSHIDLNPPGALHSSARGVDADLQAGSANFAGVDHAGTWAGTATSWNDLHPPGADSSQAWGIDGNQVVGVANVGGVTQAHLWNNETPTDLHPNGAEFSQAFAVEDGRQVGYTISRGVYRASLWTGTKNSLFDLHAILPEGSTFSMAKSIWVDENRMHVVGFGNTSGVTEALLWSCQMVTPSAMSIIRGRIAHGNLASLSTSDDNRLVLNPGAVLSTLEPPVQMRLDATAPSPTPSGFAFSIESSASFAGCRQNLSLYDFQLGTYELVDSRMLTLGDDTLNVSVRNNPGPVHPSRHAGHPSAGDASRFDSRAYTPVVSQNRQSVVDVPSLALGKAQALIGVQSPRCGRNCGSFGGTESCCLR